MDLRFEPLLPAVLVLALGAGALFAAARAYRRPSLPAWLRAGALAVIWALLAGPVLVTPAAKQEPPRLVLVLDASASMGVTDGDAVGPRLARASAALDAVARAVGNRYRVERLSLADGLTAGSATTATGGTSFDALARLADEPPAAIVLASDGGDRGLAPPDQALAAAGVPVSTLAVGSLAPAANVAVRLEPASPTAFPGQDLTLTASVTASGDAVGKQCELVISAQGEGGTAGAELLRRTLTLGADEQRVPLTLAVGERSGERLWNATVATLPGEATTDDNHAACAVQVVDRAVRLVVIEGQPYWDTSFAVRAWRRDRQLDVAAVYRLGQRRYRSAANAGAGKAVPDVIDAAALKGIDVVVIGAQADALLDAPQAAALATFVDQGGGLLFLGAGSDRDPAGPLAALDPLLHRQGRREVPVPAMTAAGRQLALLPVGAGNDALARVATGLVGGMRPRADVLVGDERQPLVVSRHHAGGMVATVNAEGLWRWTLAADGDSEVAARFWRQLVKSLVHDERSRLAADRPRYRVGQEAVISVPEPASGAVAPPLAAKGPDGQPLALAVSQGSARLRLDRPGFHIISRGTERLTVIAEADVRELTDIARRDDRLARLAGATGGDAAPVDQAVAIASRLVRRADLRIAAPRITPLVSSPWWLLAVAALLAGEWWLRRRKHGVV